MWDDDCVPNRARGTFHATPVTVHVYRPRSGVLPRMTVRPRHRRAFTLSAVEATYWYWV